MTHSKPGERDYQNTGAKTFDLSFLDQGFYNSRGNLREELLDQEAKKLAQRFGPKGGFDKVSSAQMRRFFGDVRELESILKREINLESHEPTDLEKYLAMVKMLKSKLAYSAGRGVIPKSFAESLSKAIDQVRSPKDFKAFVLFFESIVGYYFGEGGGRIR